jgi:hypothetical protein
MSAIPIRAGLSRGFDEFGLGESDPITGRRIGCSNNSDERGRCQYENRFTFGSMIRTDNAEARAKNGEAVAQRRAGEGR